MSARLRYELGFPTPEISQKLFDEMDLQRAVQYYLWGYPAVESNWIETVPGRGFYPMFRLYSPTEGLFDGTWVGTARRRADLTVIGEPPIALGRVGSHDRRHRMMQRRIRSVTCSFAVIVMLALAGAACSSDPDTAASQGCAELATLKDSLTALTQVEPVQDGLTALQSAVATVKTDLQSAATAVSEALKPSVDQVQSSFDQLENALQGVTANNLAASATEIGTALTAVGAALTDLESELTEECP